MWTPFGMRFDSVARCDAQPSGAFCSGKITSQGALLSTVDHFHLSHTSP